jgi:TolA-binding protein
MTTDKKPVMIYLSDELVNFLSNLAVSQGKVVKSGKRKGEPVLATMITDILNDLMKLEQSTKEPEKTNDITIEITNLKEQMANLKQTIENLELNSRWRDSDIAEIKTRLSELEKPTTTKLEEPEKTENEITETIKPETKDYNAAIEKIKSLKAGGMKPGGIAQLIQSLGYKDEKNSNYWTTQKITQIIKHL